jgi:8-oxo-dGTP pyrophosphatase MutT (NUDIX family)
MKFKIPVSVLVVVYTPELDVLLLNRADKPGFWQSVTGSQEAGESLEQTAVRELGEETGLDAAQYRLDNWCRAGCRYGFPRRNTWAMNGCRMTSPSTGSFPGATRRRCASCPNTRPGPNNSSMHAVPPVRALTIIAVWLSTFDNA